MSKVILTLSNCSRNVGLLYKKLSTCPRPDYGPSEVMRTSFMNGIKVAAAMPLGNQLASCTIMYDAGSRFEVDDQLGASHFIRVCANGSGCGYSSFAKSRMLQQLGGYISCSADRESIAFTLRCPPSSFRHLNCFLMDMAVRCCYLQWEVDDRKPIIKDQIETMHPEQRAMDLVQKASWAGPLANPVFCEEERIDAMSGNSLNCFVKTHFKANRCTVASVGVPFDDTLRLAENIQFFRDPPLPYCLEASYPRGGFELYDLGACSDTWIAVAVPGVGANDISCLLKYAIIAAACGTTNMQQGQHSLDRILEPPLGLTAGNDEFTNYKAFNISYKETGVFGILAKTRAKSAFNVAYAAAEFLANVDKLDFKQIEIGKKRLKLSMALHNEDAVKVSEGLALEIANNVQIDSIKHSVAMINSICPDEVKCAAQAISSKRGSMSVAVVGDIGAVPHDREMVCGAF